jgi:T5SS/PEP-CTERM-associated repeat protein
MLSSDFAFLALGPFSGIGNGADGTETVDAIVTVRGADSEWVSDQFLNIASGQNTNGTLIVTSDGVVSTTDLKLGVDDTDVGILRVQNGGLVKADKFRVATEPGSLGTVLVSDAHITNRSDDGFNKWVIGVGGDAKLKITAGGKVINDQGIDFMVAQFPGSSANINLTGTGSLIDVVGGGDREGHGFLGFGWNLNGEGSPGGKCKVTLGKGTVIRADGIFVGPDCIIKGKGTLQGFVTNNGGFIAPSITIEPIP